MPKPEVLLYDDVYHWTTLRPKQAVPFSVPKQNTLGFDRILREYRIRMRRAQRFYLADDFTETSMAVSRDLGKLTQWSYLSRLPYGDTWLEFDCHTKVEASRRDGTLMDPGAPLDDVPPRMGFLLHTIDEEIGAWSLNIFSDGAGDRGRVGVHAVTYYFAPEAPTFPLKRGRTLFDNDQPRGLVSQALGALGKYAYIENDFKNRIDIDFEDTLAVAQANADDRTEKVIKEYYAHSMVEEAGILRWTIAILAMMAEAPTEKHYFPAVGPHMASGKQKPYFDHNVITLKLPKHNAVAIVHKTLLKSTRERRKNRRHGVRGHWRIANPGKPLPFRCKHEPTQIERGIGMCGRCERKIRWQKDFERGDASLGYVVHDYVIEADGRRHRRGKNHDIQR